MCYIYRFINKNDEIIYIGQTKNLYNRINNHSHLPDDCYNEMNYIEYIVFDSEDDMNIAETYFISKWKPKYNTINVNKNINLDIPSLNLMKWISYESMIDEEIDDSMRGRRTVRVGLLLDKQLKDDLRFLCSANNNCSLNDFIIKVLLEYIETPKNQEKLIAYKSFFENYGGEM